MNFKDTWATKENGERFIFTVEMQRSLHKAGLPIEVASLDKEPVEKAVSAPPVKQAPPQEPAVQENDDVDPKSIHFDEPSSIQIDPATGKYIGRIKWYNEVKGFGFLYRGAKEDVFFHKTDVICDPDDLDQGTWILYDVEKTDKGLEASEVELYQK